MKPIKMLVLVSCGTVTLNCGGEEKLPTQPPPTPVPTSMQLSATTVALRMGETRQLTATVLDQLNRPMSGQTIAWSSTDTTKVTVDGTGLARGVRPGTATLTAARGQLTATAQGSVLAPQLVVEEGSAITVPIGAAGGTVSAQAANGAHFTLTVPATALLESVDITMTAITTIQNLPTGATLVAAVQLRPDGLTFLSPAALTMDLPSAASATNLVGLRFADDGSALRLMPITRAGTRLTLALSHFSGAGAADMGCLPLALVAPTSRDVALNGLAFEQCKAQQTGSADAAAIVNILHTWYIASVKPGLAAMPTGASLTAAFSEWAEWRHTIDDYLPVIGPISSLNADVAEALTLVVAVLKAEINRLNQQCIADQDLAAAEKVFFWQTKAQGEQLATTANGLDLASVKAGLCVKVELEQTNFPSTVQQGSPATLTVKAGLRFGTGGVVYTPSLRVSVTVTGATPASGVKMTDQAGEATFVITPTGGTAVQIAIHVAPVTPSTSLDANGVSRDATLNRQTPGVSITLTPTAAILNPGTQATFTATVSGVANANVTWTWTGAVGNPPSSGNTVTYTAGSLAGQYSITARSVADPTKSVTAQVTIVVVGVTVAISPSSAGVGAGGTLQFNATVTGSTNQSVTWSATGGSINATGLYTAGNTTGLFSVTATSAADPSVKATAQVAVGFAIGDIYVGTLQMQPGWSAAVVPCANQGATSCPIGVIFNTQQNVLVICYTRPEFVGLTIYHAACASLGPPFSSSGQVSYSSVGVEYFGRFTTPPRGGCYLQGMLQGVTVTPQGHVQGTSMTATLYCPIPTGGAYLPLYTLSATRQ